LKELSPSDWLAFTSLDGITPVKKTLDRDAVLIVLNDGARRFKKLKWETVLA
jgi:hypothetical protein